MQMKRLKYQTKKNNQSDDQLELERIRVKSEFVQQAESLVLDEILEQSAMPYPDSTPILNKYKRCSAEKKEAAFFSSQYNNRQKQI